MKKTKLFIILLVVVMLLGGAILSRADDKGLWYVQYQVQKDALLLNAEGEAVTVLPKGTLLRASLFAQEEAIEDLKDGGDGLCRVITPEGKQGFVVYDFLVKTNTGR